MKFMRRTAGYILLDHRRNDDISEELTFTFLNHPQSKRNQHSGNKND
jgi:hypothetical protein